MSFNTLQGGRSFPIDHAGGGGGGIPWSQGFGSVQLGNLVSGFFRPDIWNQASTASLATTVAIFPAAGGVLNYLSFKFLTTFIAVDLTITVLVDGVATALTFVVPAGTLVGEIVTPVSVAPAAGPHNIEVRHTSAAPGAANTNARVFVGGIVSG